MSMRRYRSVHVLVDYLPREIFVIAVNYFKTPEMRTFDRVLGELMSLLRVANNGYCFCDTQPSILYEADCESRGLHTLQSFGFGMWRL